MTMLSVSFSPNGRSMDIISGTAADTMPPFYYFLLHFWGFISQQIWFLRSLNVLLSITTIYMVYILVTSFGGKKAGLLAAFFTAISPFQVYHAQEIRMYVILELAIDHAHIFFLTTIFQNRTNSQKGISGSWNDPFWCGRFVFT